MSPPTSYDGWTMPLTTMRSLPTVSGGISVHCISAASVIGRSRAVRTRASP
jgi:hypothetical protein